MTRLDINGKAVTVDVPANTPLLWTLRDELGLTGTKCGCGMALCGACTVHLDGTPTRSCVTPISAAEGKKVTTIEGIGATPVGQRVEAAARGPADGAPWPRGPQAGRSLVELRRLPPGLHLQCLNNFARQLFCS